MPMYVAYGPLAPGEQPSVAKVRHALGAISDLKRMITEGVGRAEGEEWVIRRYNLTWNMANIAQAICDVSKLPHDDGERFRLNAAGQLRRV